MKHRKVSFTLRNGHALELNPQTQVHVIFTGFKRFDSERRPETPFRIKNIFLWTS